MVPRHSIAVILSGFVAIALPVPVMAQEQNACSMSGKLNERFRGNIELYEQVGQQRVRGLIQYNHPEEGTKLSRARFDAATDIRLSIAFDFDIPLKNASLGSAGLAEYGITNLHILVGRLVTIDDALDTATGTDLLRMYNVDATIQAANADLKRYKAERDALFSDGLFTFANGDLLTAQGIYRTVVTGESSFRQSLSVSVRTSTVPRIGVDAYMNLSELGNVSDRLLSAASRLEGRAQAGECARAQKQ